MIQSIDKAADIVDALQSRMIRWKADTTIEVTKNGPAYIVFTSNRSDLTGFRFRVVIWPATHALEVAGKVASEIYHHLCKLNPEVPQ